MARRADDAVAETIFVFFALQVEPGDIPPVAALALLLAVVTAATKNRHRVVGGGACRRRDPRAGSHAAR